MIDYVQVTLQACNLILSLVGIYYWRRIGRNNLSLDAAVWWPIALLINNSLYSFTSILWLTQFISLENPLILTYWSQSVRIQLCVTLAYGAWLMERILGHRSERK